jgi:hypothetical protein
MVTMTEFSIINDDINDVNIRTDKNDDENKVHCTNDTNGYDDYNKVS